MQAVELDDVDDVVVHQRAVERPTGFRLHGFLQIFVFDLFVAFESEPLDGRIFHDGDEDARAVARNLHVFEQAGAVKALDCNIERGGIECAVGGRVKMRADHVGVDVPVAVDCDSRRRLRGSGQLPSRRGDTPTNQEAEKCGCHPTKHERGSATQPGATYT